MEILIIALRVLFFALPSAALVEIIAAIFSKRVRHYIAQRLFAHIIWFIFALFGALMTIVRLSPIQT
jgi:hypothetical protein